VACRQLVADFSAGNGGAVDAVVKQANVGSGGKVTQIPIMLFRLIWWIYWCGGDFCGIFSELSGGVFQAEIVTGNHI
jgi:hypothetical protein